MKRILFVILALGVSFTSISARQQGAPAVDSGSLQRHCSRPPTRGHVQPSEVVQEKSPRTHGWFSEPSLQR